MRPQYNTYFLDNIRKVSLKNPPKFCQMWLVHNTDTLTATRTAMFTPKTFHQTCPSATQPYPALPRYGARFHRSSYQFLRILPFFITAPAAGLSTPRSHTIPELTAQSDFYTFRKALCVRSNGCLKWGWSQEVMFRKILKRYFLSYLTSTESSSDAAGTRMLTETGQLSKCRCSPSFDRNDHSGGRK